jgi:hypothetical protein
LFFSIPALPQDYAVSAKISSVGISLEGLRKINDNFIGRAGFSFFSYSLSETNTDEDFNYDADLHLFSVSFLADYFPFQNNLRITGGFFINLNKADIVLNPSKSYRIGGTIYTPALLGSVSGKIKFNTVSPYIGLGFGNFMMYEKFLFSFDIGTIYQGNPKVDLDAKGLLKPTKEEEPKIEDNLSWFKFYPVVSLGITYIF